VASEIKAALDTGVLKNHRNDTFTRLKRNTARTTHAYKKAQETRQQKKTLNIVDEELASLKDSQKENAARIKQLKATNSNIAKKGKSSKAESSSSGKVAATGITVSKRKRAEKASRLATIKEGTFYIQSVFASF
jgi:16S rRNA C967 or C1407 C5-methylase (RsmB/RsmF family)